MFLQNCRISALALRCVRAVSSKDFDCEVANGDQRVFSGLISHRRFSRADKVVVTTRISDINVGCGQLQHTSIKVDLSFRNS